MSKPEKYRSEFGERLYKARLASGLSQTALAKKAGMAQSTLVEAETIAQGSAKTTQLALATGVDPYWLATGVGNMQPSQLPVREEVKTDAQGARSVSAPIPMSPTLSTRQLVLQLGARISDLDHLARIAIAPLLQRLAEHPEESEQIAGHVERAVSGNEPPPAFTSSLGVPLTAKKSLRIK